jgi:hypothetical protein
MSQFSGVNLINFSKELVVGILLVKFFPLLLSQLQKIKIRGSGG